MNDELCIRLRTHHVKAGTVHLFIRYSLAAHHGEGYAHQMKLTIPTDLNSDLYASLLYLYNIYTDRKALIRGVNISFGSLTSSKNKQLSLFEDYEAQNKEEQLFTAIDELQNKYGKNSVLRADSLTKASTIKERHNQIGGVVVHRTHQENDALFQQT
jgi:DNA polymerase V